MTPSSVSNEEVADEDNGERELPKIFLKNFHE